MMRAGIQRALLGAYRTANRRGWLDSTLAEVVFQRGYFAYKRLVEDPFAKLVTARPELFRGGDVIDVGANTGYTALVFARAVEPPHRVHAFEPEARNFRWLGRAIERARMTGRVVTQRAAVGAREGTIELWRNDAHHADHRIATDRIIASGDEPTQRVPVTTLDAYLARCGWPAVAFVKIDVQGYEPEVLRGMAETLARNPGVHVAIEIHPSGIAELGFDAADLTRELSSALPRMAVLERDGRLREIDAGAVAAEAARNELGYVDLVCAAR